MTRSRPNFAVTLDTYAMAVELHDRHARLERDLLAVVLCDPAPGVAKARRHGVNDSLFLMDGYRLIWLACEWAAERKRGTLSAVRAAIFLLKHGAAFGMWTNRRVCELAESYSRFPSPMQALDVKLTAKRLIEVHGALVVLDRSHREAFRACEKALARRVA